MTDSNDGEIAPPETLGEHGLNLWHSIESVYVLTPDAVEILTQACRASDMCAKLDALAADSPALVKGSMGQQVISPYISELRQWQATQQRLLAALKLEPLDDSEEGSYVLDRHTQARRAAHARWGNYESKRKAS